MIQDVKVIKYKNWELHGDCANLKGELTKSEISELASVEKLRVIQPWRYLPKNETWLMINSEIYKKRPDVELCIWADIFPIGFEFLSEMTEVRNLELNQVKFKNKTTLKNLVALNHLKINSGNINNLEFLEKFSQLKTLEISLIKKLDNISFISEMKNLKTLSLYGLRNITDLPPLKKNINLEEIFIFTMKQLTNISAIEDANDLKKLHCGKLNPVLKPAQFQFLKKLKNLKEVKLYFNTKAKQKEFDDLFPEFLTK